MRSPKEIEQLVKENKHLPKFADPAEQYYYDMMQLGVERYRTKILSKDDLLKFRKEKQRVYEHMQQHFKLSKKYNDLAIELSQVHLCGCEQCKRVARILEGRASCE